MSDFELLLVAHGVWLVALVVAVDQLGIPIPAPPALVVAGGLVGNGDLSAIGVVAAGTTAAALGSLVWFGLGRRLGGRILGPLCRISLEPDSCVRSTRESFERRGPKTLLFARFVPGMQTVTPPLSGMSGMPIPRFLAWDVPGALFWVAGYVALGALLHEQVDLFLELLASFGAWLGLVLIGGLALWILGKFVQRQRFLRRLRMARISPAQLRELIERGCAPAIFDLRSPFEVGIDGHTIPGAHRIGLDQLDERHQEIPRDREIVLFCSCPNEATAAQVAFQLERRGIGRVRPLAGGLAAWVEAGNPPSRRYSGRRRPARQGRSDRAVGFRSRDRSAGSGQPSPVRQSTRPGWPAHSGCRARNAAFTARVSPRLSSWLQPGGPSR